LNARRANCCFQRVVSVDLKENESASENIVLQHNSSWLDQEKTVLESMAKIVGSEKLDAILCVAGGWSGGNAASKEMIRNSEVVWKQSVWSSSICARLAAIHLRPGGLLQFTGAAPAINGTGSMIGYGMAKAAVHQLTKSLASDGSGLPKDCTSVAILPTCLDTPANRKSMWTSLESIAEILYNWIVSPSSRPPSGSLVKVVTADETTRTEIV
uniref:Dihydropteridine reductase n=1 Tax=Enterobius vermicularis TaxID=51028 RepID=A0A0N4V8A9_ENTVE